MKDHADHKPEWRDAKYYWQKKPLKEKSKIITIDVIDTILRIPDAYVYAFDRHNFYSKINDCFEQTLTVSKICRFFNGLKRSKYIEVTKLENGQESIRFTNKAKLRALDAIAESLDWDGRYRLVSFDIPERLRRNRDCFRRAIKRLGFKQIQKSLWVCRKNIGDLVEMAALEYSVIDYVVYIVVEKTDIDNTITSMFSDNQQN